MPNPIIKFSHQYKKLLLPDGSVLTKAKLLDVLEINLNSLSATFLAYDTDAGLYELPKEGTYLMLIFLKQPNDVASSISCDLFTTLRRSTLTKLSYYKNIIGKIFDVELIAEGKQGNK